MRAAFFPCGGNPEHRLVRRVRIISHRAEMTAYFRAFAEAGIPAPLRRRGGGAVS